MNAIAIMAKAPFPDKVKTRLTPPLSPFEASRLYHSFLLDKIEQVKCIEEARPFMAYTPESSESFFRSIIPPGFFLIGMRAFIPEIFSGIPWSTALVTELTEMGSKGEESSRL